MKINKKILLISYTLLLGAILYYPLRTIQRIEFPVQPPLEVKFQVTLYDPYDPMRGRFVRLQVLPDLYHSPVAVKTNYRTPLYAVLKRDADGMGQIIRLETDPGKIGKEEYFVRVTGWEKYHSGKEKKNTFTYFIRWPFEQFYLNELKAPELEQELRKKDTAKKFRLQVQVFPGGFWAVSGLENKNQ